MNATASNIIDFPAAVKCFRSIAWNGKIHGECSTIPFRRSTVNPDATKFEECTEYEMRSARGTKASRLYIETQNGKSVEVWGWL